MTRYPVLYSFRRCPYAIRARLALLSSATCCELREVMLRDKPAHLLEVSPKGTVQVMVLPDGAVLDQSLDIMLWALGRNDPAGWLPKDATRRSAQLHRIAACDGEFKAQLDRYKYPSRFGLTTSTIAQDLGAVYLTGLEQSLAQDRFLSGDAWGLADAAIAPFVRQWAHSDPAAFAQQPWPYLQVWLVQFEQSPLFEAAMVRPPPWKASAEPVWFGG